MHGQSNQEQQTHTPYGGVFLLYFHFAFNSLVEGDICGLISDSIFESI